MRKSVYFSLILAYTFINAFAQQRPQYTQYVFNNYLLNPALSGIENYTDVKIGHRAQWTGLEGAPVTSFLSVNAPIGSSFIRGDATSFSSGEGQNPFSRANLLDYKASEPHHGIGLMIISDKTGAISETNINATYAYHLGLSSRVNLSVGILTGIVHHMVNTSLLTINEQDDATFTNLNDNQWKPDLGIGIWAYSRDFFLGASVQQLFTQRLYNEDNNKGYYSQTVPHYFVSAGVRLAINDDIGLLPSALIKFVRPLPTSADFNLKLSFRNKFWVGASYRQDDAVTGMAGFNLNSFVNVSYGYDVSHTALRHVNNGTHEIMIGLLLNNYYKLTCPMHGF